MAAWIQPTEYSLKCNFNVKCNWKAESGAPELWKNAYFWESGGKSTTSRWWMSWKNHVFPQGAAREDLVAPDLPSLVGTCTLCYQRGFSVGRPGWFSRIYHALRWNFLSNFLCPFVFIPCSSVNLLIVSFSRKENLNNVYILTLPAIVNQYIGVFTSDPCEFGAHKTVLKTWSLLVELANKILNTQLNLNSCNIWGIFILNMCYLRFIFS